MPRFLDLLLAVVGLVAISPIFLLIALVLKVLEKGPVFYRARRVGKGGEQFGLFKFRTMIVEADRIGPGITTAGDARITKLGGFLRRWKIDELPQLINVVRGEMALVGPRPEDPRYVASYSTQQRSVLDVRPGITSPASLVYREETELLSGENWERRYREEILPHKIALELEYMKRRSLWTDLGLIFRTLRGILK